MSPRLANPAGLHGETASHFSVDAEFVLTEAVAFGDSVAFTGPGTVEKMDAADAPGLFAGIAQESGVAGDVITVTSFGWALANVGAAGVPALGLPAIQSGATSGLLLQGAAPDATTIAGSAFGTFGGAKDANNRAWVWLSRY